LRLKNGIAPVNAMASKGLNVAMGTDSTALNDDDDMIQEMRLVSRLHREPAIVSPSVSSHQVLAMATINAAAPTFFHDRIGALEVGRRADMVLLEMSAIEEPYMDPDVDIIDALLYRGKSRHIDTVLIDGRVVLKDGEFPGLSKADVVKELREQLARPIEPSVLAMRNMVQQLTPYVERFYQSWGDGEGQPHYRYNSRV
jgi:5-methylthioadenosine/S-adenosylhomocysteine deaminase